MPYDTKYIPTTKKGYSVHITIPPSSFSYYNERIEQYQINRRYYFATLSGISLIVSFISYIKHIFV